MSLTIGARLGAYEILAPLGAGGMGEVYRARDTRLDRDVALKILPDAFANEPGRLARFEREAKTLALLNHPNIAGIYSVEEANGITALAMELVEGEDLSHVITRGAIPVEDALPMARQIADALHAAHEQGIIHRDLKPANIKLRPDGTVKVLDFGLAKALAPEPGDADADVLSDSPTVSSPATMTRPRQGDGDAGTGVGVILGTPAYMAPEQARGKGVDKRADIWAFGCVLYEMLTGARAFEGEDVVALMAAVIKSEPSWKALPPEVPTPIVTLLRGCLAKERRNRIADIGVATFVLTHAEELVGGALSTAEARHSTASSQRRRWRRALVTAASVASAALVASIGMWLLTRPASPSVVRTTITTSGAGALSLQGTDRDVAITPDGSRIVYRGNNVLLVRALNQFAPTVLSGLGAPRGPFVSPNGESVGYFDLNTNTVRTVAITGGPPATVCGFQGAPRGATWGPDGSIIFSTNAAGTGLQRVSASGGAPTALTTSLREGEGNARWPEFLPGGKAVLFTIVPVTGGSENTQVAVLDLGTRTSKVLVQAASHAQYVSTGHLVYGVGGTLHAVAFDLQRLEVNVRASATVLEGVVTTAQGAVNAAISANGSLVYVSGGAMGGGPTRIMAVDRTGRAVSLPGLPLDSYRDVRVSPNGRYLAVATMADVWAYDTELAVSNRVTIDVARENNPLWTPDGNGIVYTSFQAGYPELYWRLANGTGSARRLLTRAKDLIDLFPNGWSQDGKQLLFTEMISATVRGAIGQMAIERPSDVKVLLKDDFNNQFAALSPDGYWLAYTSNRSSRPEIYVDRYPDFGDPHRISTDGGTRPVWSRDATELYFSNNNRQIFVAKVKLGTTFVAGRPEQLFEFPMSLGTPGSRPYDIGRDGQFYIIRSGQEEADGVAMSGLNLIENWFEELKQRVPVN